MLGFPGDQELILVVEFEVLDGRHTLSYYHLLNLFFMSVYNFTQNYGLQGCWPRFTFLPKGGKQCYFKYL